MNITKAQRIKILELWAKVCKAHEWKVSDRGLRLATIGKILGREIQSLDDVGRTAECTKVFAELQVMLGVSLRAGLEANDPTLNKARNYRHVIMNELTPCLGVYVADVTGYITAIMEDKNRWWKIDRPAVEITLEDLDAKPIFRRVKGGELKEFPSTLEQLMMTLAARINTLRNKAGDDIHTMKTKAGVFCGCAQCDQARVRQGLSAQEKAQLVPPLHSDDSATSAAVIKAEDPNWTV